MSDFPLLRNQMPEGKDMFVNLQKAIEKLEPSLELTRLYNTDYFTVDGISNYWSEKQRLIANVKGSKNLFDVWANEKERKEITAKSEELMVSPRDAMMTMGYRECNTFNPLIMAQVFKNYFHDQDLSDVTMLDPSAGWGDRLIGALALGIGHYLAFDPNKYMHPVYNKIANDLGEDTKVTLYDTRFKKINGFTVDIVFTSPPFFDYELYPGSEKDVAVPYSKLLGQLNTPYIKNAIAMLKEDGLFCIYVHHKLGNDTRTIMKRNGMQYVRDIIFQNNYINYFGQLIEGKKRPIQIWKKNR